jgi:hypothetical protein
MKLINFNDLPYFEFISDMLDFNKVYGDDEIVCIPLTVQTYNNDTFNKIRDVFEERMREFYFEEDWNEGIIDGEFSLVIWNDENSYTYHLQFLADQCNIEMDIRLNEREKSILSPIIQKYFYKQQKQYDIHQARIEVAKTFANNVPNEVLGQLRLQTDTFNGKRYRSAWITDDCASSVFATIENCLKPDCPVKLVKFEC